VWLIVSAVMGLCGAVVSAQTTPPKPSPTPAFKSGVDVVSLNVTVTDGLNHYVTDLEPEEFSVFEDGVKQPITFFTRRQQPIALSLLLDSSASMEQHLDMLQIAASNFVRRLKPNDIAQIIDFDSRVEIRQAFTSNQTDLEAAIRQTAAGGSTSLHNAIYIALRELRKVRAVYEEDVRRQALIVFSDGEDTSSLVAFDEVLELAKQSETAIYTIALRGADTQSKGFKEAEYVLRTLARETGGRSFFPLKPEDLAGVYVQIADELASQYTIGYISQNPKRDGAWRRLVVQTARPSLTCRTKNGYYAPKSR
jgi:Ca-activated chloride channel family protein